jgi:broad specificity phosphatase PhoE
MAHDAAEALRGPRHHRGRRSPLQRAQETARPTAELFGVDIVTDERLLESENVFEGKTVGVGDGAPGQPGQLAALLQPVPAELGRAVLQIATRMLAAAEAARDLARGHEAVCVSHQLPIWTLRRYVEGRRMWHRPDRRPVRPRLADQPDLDGRPAADRDLQRARRDARVGEPSPRRGA